MENGIEARLHYDLRHSLVLAVKRNPAPAGLVHDQQGAETGGRDIVEAAAEVLEAAFGDDAVYDGVSYRIEPGISRKKVLVPAITDILEAYPKE